MTRAIYAMSEAEFIDAHRPNFVAQDGRNIVGVISIDDMTLWPIAKHEQSRGRLLVAPETILRRIYQVFVAVRAA